LADVDRLNLTGTDGAVRLPVRVVPRAGRTALDGATNTGALRVRLTAPPVEGAANAALIAFLADILGVPKRNVAIVRGERGRDKMLEIAAPLVVIQERLRAAIGQSRH
jgi:uncharacterized protein